MLPSKLVALVFTLVRLCTALPTYPRWRTPSLKRLISMLPNNRTYCHDTMAFRTHDQTFASNTTLPTERSTLDNEIHPMFGHAYWSSWLPMDVAYTNMRPALQLVSLFLTTPEWQDWYVRIKNDNLASSPNSFILPGDVPRASDDERLKSIQDWEDLSGTITFAFHGASKKLKSLLGAYWKKCPLPQLTGHRDEWDDTTPTLFLHEGFYCRLINTDSFSPLENLRFQFSLATVMLHELGHTWHSKWHQHDETSEMGFSWEDWAFGTRLEQTDLLKHGTMRATGGFLTNDFQDVYPVPRNIFAIVPDEWILRWFDKATWQNATAMRQSEGFYPPSTRDHPEEFKAMRFHNNRLRYTSYNRSRESNTTKSHSGHICDTKHPHPDCPSVRQWYSHVWDRESKVAFMKHKLPVKFLYPSHYRQFLGKYKPPVWARGRLRAMGIWRHKKTKTGSHGAHESGNAPILF